MLVFAHRGASDVAPGNTLKAFELAIEAGTFAIESDVRATRDGRLVFFHDSSVRIGGRFIVPSSWLPVSWFREFDAGGGIHVPLVKDVFDHFATTGILRNITWSLDVPNDKAFNYLVKITQLFNIQPNMQVCATSCKINGKWHRVAPSMLQVWSIRTKQIDRLTPSSIVSDCKKCKVDILNIKLTDVTADLVDEARAAGLSVYIWDVHDETRYKKAMAFKPDAIYTNSPSHVLHGTWKS